MADAAEPPAGAAAPAADTPAAAAPAVKETASATLIKAVSSQYLNNRSINQSILEYINQRGT